MEMVDRDFLIANEKKLPEWMRSQYGIWRKTVEDKQFPCYFGTQAEKRGILRYCFSDMDGLKNLPNILAQFLKFAKMSGKRNALVLFIKSAGEKMTFDCYRSRFWHILNELHAKDDMAWPSEYPRDPEDPGWEFVYNGEQIFVSGNMPAYEKRITRHIGDCQIMIFQPRRIFRGIESNTKAGQKASELIRKRTEMVENMRAHPDLGQFGTKKLEWKQYVISDDDVSEAGKCPFAPIKSGTV